MDMYKVMPLCFRQEHVSEFIRDLGYTIGDNFRRDFVRVSGQDEDNDETYTFVCGVCPDGGSVVPGTEDPSDIGASKYDCRSSTQPSVREFNQMTIERQCRYPEMTFTHKLNLRSGMNE